MELGGSGGVEVMASCDLRVAVEDQNGARLGGFCCKDMLEGSLDIWMAGEVGRCFVCPKCFILCVAVVLSAVS